MNNILEFLFNILRTFGHIDWLNQLIVLSLQATLIVGLLWPFRKWLAKVTDTRVVVRVLSVSMLSNISAWLVHLEMLDLRWWYEFIGSFFGIADPAPSALLHLSLPARVKSQIAEIPSSGSIDWLLIGTIVWWIGPLLHDIVKPDRHERDFRRLVKRNRRDCPERMHKMLDDLNAKHGSLWNDEIDLIWVDGLSSPCTFRDGKHIIALDRIDYSDDELELILRHELAHIASNHLRMMSTLRMLRNICWFNPIFYYLEHWCSRHAELAADSKALGQKKATETERITYARLLVTLAEEKHLGGLVLHLSASARFLKQRTEAILRPNRKGWTIPVTLLLVLLMLHSTLLIAPGRTEYTVPELLVTLGNDYRYATRGIDPICKSSSSRAEVHTSLGWVDIEKNNSVVTRLSGSCEPAAISLWIDEISTLLGEPSYATTSAPGSASYALLSLLGDYREQTLAVWPITLSEEAKARIWDEPPEQVYIVLSAADYTDGTSFAIRLSSAKNLETFN